MSSPGERPPAIPGAPSSTTPSGIEALGAVPWGTHFCQFYETAEDLAGILVPYFRAGLEANEFCMWITSAPLDVEEAKAALRAAVPDLDRRVAAGQIEVLDHGEGYAPGGAFDPDRVLRGWTAKLEAARTQGFEGLRLGGNTFWLEPADWDAFTRYEGAVNAVIGRHRMLAICAYSLRKCGALEILDILANHDFALIRRSGRWVAIGSEHRPKAEGSFPESEDRFRTLLETMGERTAELARSDERFRLALRIASIQLGDFDRDLRYRWVYDPGSGFDQARVAGRRFDELNPGPDAGRFVAFQKSVLETGSGARAEMAFGAGDARRVYDVIAEPLRDHAGGVTGLLTAAMDITQQRRLEAQFLQARKMEAIGRLAGGIAHDFNNMMQVVAGFAARMLRNLAAGDPLRPDVEGIRRTAERAADLTRKLLALGRRQVLQSVVLDLNQLVSEAVPMLRRTLGDDIEILMLLQPGLGRVKADPGSLEQILVNLAANARDAMPRGGTLTLETSDVEIGESPSFGEPVVAPGPYVRLSVTDTGCGMDKETLANLFEPFFTTKPRGKGTGLGLATSYGTVRQSGGILRVCSEPGQGTTFEISLPRVEDALHPRETGKAPAPAPGGSETILLVEDDEDVRRLMALELEDLGYQVIQARDRGEALQRSRERRGPIHLLLTDVILAGPSGRAVAESLGEERPGIRTLYISGHTEAHIVRRGILIPGTHFLQKPFSTEQLATKIREALAGAPRPPDAAETDAPGCKPGAP